MTINTSDQQNKQKEFAPIINIKFLKILVIVLGLGIFALIFLIIFKVLNGDLQKNKFEKVNLERSDILEFNLGIPNFKSIKSIDLDNENILIITDDNDSLNLITITKSNKLKVIKIINSNRIKFNKLN